MRIVLMAAMFCAVAFNAGGAVWYVDKDNAGTENGTSWATAYNSIQEGIDAAFAAGGGEVWVAVGVYNEARTSPNADGSGLDTGSIVMKSGVHLYGGFAGAETQRDQRDWETNETVLNGASARGGSAAYHVIVGANNATLDGFTVTGGNASGGDNANRGGGMFNFSSSPTVSNCSFSQNSADYDGGGMSNYNFSTPTITNCIFTANSTNGGGGGMYSNSSSPTITNCSFFGNSATNGGGGMINFLSSPTVKNCILWGNINADWYDLGGGAPVVTYSDIGTGYSGGGTGNISADPKFVDAANGNLRLLSDSPCIDTGTAAGAPATDILGVSRPQGAGVDMGAYETDYTPPVITRIGASPVTIEVFSVYVDAGATAVDNVDGDITASIVTVNPVNTGVLGAYTVRYNVSDASGNAALEVTRTVNVIATAAPSAPSNPGATNISSTQIRWTWLDTSDDEAGFKVYADPGAGPPVTLQTTTAADVQFWDYTSLTPNTQYAFQVATTNGSGDSERTPNYARYTLAGPPTVDSNVRCDKSAGAAYPADTTFTFSNPSGFGAESHFGSGYRVSTFKYVWDSSTTHAFTGAESDWSNGIKSFSPTASGSYYLHLQSFNAESVAGGTLDYGPFIYDPYRPVITTNGGANFPTEQSSVTLQGTCPATTNLIRVNGSTLGVIYAPGQTTWSFNGALTNGANVISITAVDGLGNVSTVVTITVSRLPVYYVDLDNSSETKNGLSWATAFTDIQSAVDAAFAAGGGIVWVAEGVYDEVRTSLMEDVNTGSVVMKSRVHLFGGFTGAESTRDQRDWQTHITTIDGSKSRGGQAAYHVVIGANNATLDGFTVSGGIASSDNLNSFGAGMYNYSSSSPQVTNCTFSGNQASYFGGGMYNGSSSSPRVTNCIFIGNSADSDGGGMYNNSSSSPIVTDCTFTDNSTFTGDSAGMSNHTSSSPIVTNCTFIRNLHGGMANYSSSSPTVTNCTFTENSGGWTGGGMGNFHYSSPTVVDCTFTDNSAGYGGGMGNFNYSSPTVVNCTFTGNAAAYGGGGGMYNNRSAPTVLNCTFAGNSGTDGGAMWNYEFSSPAVTNCVFTGNLADNRGAITNWGSSSPIVIHCTFFFNSPFAMYNAEASLPTVTNSILWNNAQGEIIADEAAQVTYSDIKGGYPGTGNIDADPAFLDAAQGNFGLHWGSPCIDIGTATDAPATDILGVSRPQATGVDMGAYEAPIPLVSRSHPTSSLWYNQSTFRVEWDAADFPGAAGWLWVLDDAPNTVVTLLDGQYEDIAVTSLRFPDQPHGAHYFHLVPIDGGGALIGAQQADYGFIVNTKSPLVTSSTHPVQDQTYTATNVSLAWSNPDISSGSAVKHYFAFDTSPNYVPIKLDTNTISLTKIYFGQSVGSHYFHVVTEDAAGTLSPAAHFRVNVKSITGPVAGGGITTPLNVTPANNTVITTVTPTLTATGFSDPVYGGATHQASEWQVWPGSGSPDAPLWDSGRDTANKTSVVVPAGQIEDGVAYEWRVRFQSSSGLWSDWSAATAFSTANTVRPPTPEITTNGGADFITNESQVALDGTCDAVTQEIRVNGSTSGVTYTPGQTVWSYSGTLAQGANFYSVTAVNIALVESLADTITVTRDIIAPQVSGAVANGSGSVAVTFSEPMADDAALTNPLFYTFSTEVGIPIAASAVHVDDEQTVLVSVNPMTQGATYEVRVATASPTDVAGNHVDPLHNSASFVGVNPNPDIDGDGMPDAWELAHQLNPSDPTDAALDPDGDGLTNIEEYAADTDPQDYDSPGSAFNVDGDLGSDISGDGSVENPWKTIGFAMTTVRPIATLLHAATIYLAEGEYVEHVVFVPNVTLQGADAADPAATVIKYFGSSDDNVVVKAAQNTALKDVKVTFPSQPISQAVVLVSINNVGIELANVILDGGFLQSSTGVLAAGPESSNSILRDSQVLRLRDGVWATNSAMQVTRNSFNYILNDALFVLPPGKNGILFGTPQMGDVKQTATTGFNQFRGVEGKFIRNGSEVLTKAEFNDWGVYTVEDISAQISGGTGGVDFEPFLGKGIGPGTIAVTLFDTYSQNIVPENADPQVTLEELPLIPERDDSGVYVFSEVLEGDYTVSASAPDYESKSKDARVTALAVTAVTLNMNRESGIPGDIDGDGVVTATDVQLVINKALGLPGGGNADINCSGDADAVDVQLVINAALGLAIEGCP